MELHERQGYLLICFAQVCVNGVFPPYCSALNDYVVGLEFTVSLPYDGPASPSALRQTEAIH